jgi:heme o synthase
VFWPVGDMGLLYGASAAVLGGIFTFHAVALARSGTYAKAMRLFGWSITYITLLFGAMALDQLLPR